jgi:hypothetical protein
VASQKLPNILKIITDNLTKDQVPYALIGALALGLYGLPRFTADIDLLTEGRFWSLISGTMERLGYTCYQKTNSFAQFDSELGVLGKIDFMLVNTQEGKNILKRSVLVTNELMGNHPVIQPTDYIILKLMAIANNPARCSKDEADILAVLELHKKGIIPDNFNSLEIDNVYPFAERFGLKKKFQEYFDKVFHTSDDISPFEL